MSKSWWSGFFLSFFLVYSDWGKTIFIFSSLYQKTYWAWVPQYLQHGKTKFMPVPKLSHHMNLHNFIAWLGKWSNSLWSSFMLYNETTWLQFKEAACWDVQELSLLFAKVKCAPKTKEIHKKKTVSDWSPF